MNKPEPLVIPVDFKASPRVIKVLRIVAVAFQDVATALEEPFEAEGVTTPTVPAPVAATAAPAIPTPPADVEPSPTQVFGGNVPTATAAPSSAAADNIPTAPTADTSAAPSPSDAPPPVPLPTTGETAPEAAASAPAPAVDAAGLPWDARIHAGTKAVNADGRWKKRKGVQPLDVSKVEAELRAQLAAGAPAPVAETAPAAAPAAPVPLPPGAAAPVATGDAVPPVPVPPAPQAPAPVPPAPAAAGGLTFPQLMGRVTALMREGKVTREETGEAVVAVCGPGVALADLAKRPGDVAAVGEYLEALAAAKGV